MIKYINNQYIVNIVVVFFPNNIYVSFHRVKNEEDQK